MLRYQSKQKIKQQLEQKQLSSIENISLKTKTILRTKTETDKVAAREKLETKSQQKRKLLVYRKDDKFYIDHAAAYSLKLTNVRAIMLENPHLVEV